MRPVILKIAIVLAAVVAACGSGDSVVTGGEAIATARPAPTPAGQVVEVDIPTFSTAPVIVGLSSRAAVEVHAFPGSDQPVLGEIPAGATDVAFVGEAFESDDGRTWWLVNYETLQGWVQRQVAYQGPATDVTGEVAGLLGSSPPFRTASELVTGASQQFAASMSVPDVIEGPTSVVADNFSHTTTFDLLGIKDDSLLGYRLIVVADGSADSGATWQLNSAQLFPLCARGITAEGLCL